MKCIHKKILLLSIICGLVINANASDPEAVKQLEDVFSKKAQQNNTLDLSGYDMRTFRSLSSSDIKGKLNFKNANLKGADFSGMNIRGIYFDRSNLENANFSGSKLFSTSFVNAKLNGANFKGAEFSSVTFRHSSAKNNNFDDLVAENTNFDSTNLSGSSFSNVQLDSSNFHRSTLNDVTLKDSSLYQVGFSNLKGKKNFKTSNLKTERVSGLGIF